MAQRRPNAVILVLATVVVLAVIAVIVSSGGDDDTSTSDATSLPETRDVVITGDLLAPYDASMPTDPTVGEPAPALKGQRFDGSSITIGDTGPALVVFLAHWCPHCQREVPYLVSFFDDNGVPEGVHVYAVATGTDRSRPNYPPSTWLERERWSFPTLVDSDDFAAANAFGLSAYPYFVVLDSDGNVAARGSGELEADELESLIGAARSQ